MEHLCPICAIDASSHSFELLSRDNGINVFYTCPAKATKYNDRDGILAHFKNVLDHYKDNYWKLIFDFQGVEFKHMMEINIAIGLGKLINDYSTYLTEIQIINTNSYTYTMLRIVMPFLNSDVKNKINIKN
jgi:hypothetical protein